MLSTRPPTSKSSSPFSNPLVTVPNAPITIGIIVTFMFHSFFQFPSKVDVLLLFTFFQFYSVVSRDSKVDNFAISLFFFFLISFFFFFFFFCWLLLGLVFWPKLGDLGLCQSPIEVYVCYFLGQVLSCAYTICWYGQIFFLLLLLLLYSLRIFSTNFLSILVGHDNNVVWLSRFFLSFRILPFFFSKSLMTTVGITVTLMAHNFFLGLIWFGFFV